MPFPTEFNYVAITNKGRPISGTHETVRKCARAILNEIENWNQKIEKVFIASDNGGLTEYAVSELQELAK